MADKLTIFFILFFFFCMFMVILFAVLKSKEEDPKTKGDYGTVVGVFAGFLALYAIVGFVKAGGF